MEYPSKVYIPLAHKKHIKFFLRFLQVIPENLSYLDSQRVTIAFFAISGLDVLDAIDRISPQQKQDIIKWICSLQVLNEKDLLSGLQGSTTFNNQCLKNSLSPYRHGSIAHTYAGLASLIILGDDLSNIHRKEIINTLRALQLPEGNFIASIGGSESDMRFVYCAACICYFLDDWTGMDVNKTVQYILNSISYDYGIAQGPELESHGGPTFCAIATLFLADRLDCLTQKQLKGVQRWLIMRQEDGFQGRPNKPVDTCYSFWVGAALQILDSFKFTNYEKNRDYIISTQSNVTGGFAKWVDTNPDPLHTYFGLCGLSLLGESGLMKLMPSLNFSVRAYNHLKSIHKRWKKE